MQWCAAVCGDCSVVVVCTHAARMTLRHFRHGTGTDRLVLCWYTDCCWGRAFLRPLSSSTPLITLPSRVVGAEIQRVFL